jgi:CO dehydrogenase maturation factor
MLVISDANKKSLMTAAAIANMAREAGISHVALVGNRIENKAQTEILTTFSEQHELSMLEVVPFDAAVVRAGIDGSPILTLEGTPAFRAIEKIARRLTGKGEGGKP